MPLTRPRFEQLNTIVTNFTDPISVLNKGSSLANIDVGFIFNRDGGTSSNVAVFWDESANTFVTSFTTDSGSNNANITITEYANLRVGTITATLVNTTGNIMSSGNVTAPYFLGNGALLTGIVSGGSSYSNIQVATYLPTHSGTVSASLINSTGNILATGLSVFGNARVGLAGAVSGQFHTVVGNITQTSSGGAVYINTTGNISAAIINTSALNATGTTTAVAINSTGFINTTANISAAVVNAGALNATGNLTASQVAASNGIFVNNMTIATSYTIPTGYGASSVGPVTINSGVVVTVPSGSRWVVL